MGQIERAAGHQAVIEPGLILVDFMPLDSLNSTAAHECKRHQASGVALVACPVHQWLPHPCISYIDP